MCNDYRLLTASATLFDGFSEIKIPIRFSEGKPNLEAREDIKITDTAPIVRAVEGEAGAGELVQRRWSWPGPNGKPVYNFRSEGREFASGRCLIPADGFYEFTDPPRQKEKAQGQVAVDEVGRAMVLHCWDLADGQRRWRGVHDAHDAPWPRHRALARPPDRDSRSRRLVRLA
jgi:putative SOS response-associated peptidase YedK